jgi:molecular chaperone DnaJ
VTEPCTTCGGEGRRAVERSLQIKIPAGVDSGSQLRIGGEGEAGALGGPPGDLYVVLRVAEHAFFKREGTHLFCEVPVGVPQAALGATVEIPTLDGGRTKLTIPEGTQSGAVLRLKGQGVAALGGRGRGDLHVLVRVVVPKRLTSEQRKLFEQLSKTLPVPDLGDKDRSLLDRMKDLLG